MEAYLIHVLGGGGSAKENVWVNEKVEEHRSSSATLVAHGERINEAARGQSPRYEEDSSRSQVPGLDGCSRGAR